MTIIIFLIVLLALGLIAVGFLSELNARFSNNSTAESLEDILAAEAISAPPSTRLAYFLEHFREAVQTHPRPILARFETILWLLFLLPLLNHVLSPEHGLVAGIIWFFTIVPHEMGHLVCNPFGMFLMVAGGSIWQVLFWLLLALYSLFIRRQVVQSCVLMQLVGHSFINMAVYIRDAQERQLPLLFGMGPEHHDWGRLLDWMGLIAYDDEIAALAVITGVTIVLFSIGAGILATWLLPFPAARTRFFA